MIARLLATLLLLAFAAAPAMACRAHAPAVQATAPDDHPHDHETQVRGHEAATPHDALKATCVAITGLAAEQAAGLKRLTWTSAAEAFTVTDRAAGLSPGPASPPPRIA